MVPRDASREGVVLYGSAGSKANLLIFQWPRNQILLEASSGHCLQPCTKRSNHVSCGADGCATASWGNGMGIVLNLRFFVALSWLGPGALGLVFVSRNRLLDLSSCFYMTRGLVTKMLNVAKGC